MIDPSDRAEMISAAIENYISGEFSEGKARTSLAFCGLNATEIDDALCRHRTVAFDNFRKLQRKPVK